MDDSIHSSDCEGVPEEKENKATGTPNAKAQSPDTPGSVIASKTDQSPSKGGQCKKKYECIKKEVKWWFEVGGIFGGLVGLYLLYWQYREMAKTTEVAIGQLQAMTYQASIMQEQLDVMQSDRNLDKRAWVSSYKWTMEYGDKSNSFYFVLHIKNLGRTPAYNVGIEAEMNFTDSVVFESTNIPKSYSSTTLSPDEESSTRTPPVPIQILQAAWDDKIPLFVNGRVRYDDIFGTNHWFTVRSRMDIHANIATATPEGNEHDKN